MRTTAMRSGGHETRDGVRLLRQDPDIPYRDGAEDRLWEIVSQATDLRSESTEMLGVAEGWAEQYHTHPARANIVRSLDIPADARILEIGSGCGPITRYLGETGALVDSVEPVLPRARVGRERTRDLPNVEVFCGNLEDVPSDPAYDIVVVIGVLEYVGSGAPESGAYLAFLRECRKRVRPGGSLVLAIENKLGVKYLTGTGEDHSGRIFDSIEDYPRGSPARTFSATALCDLISESGFSPRLFGVFPDYKHTRVVLDSDRLQIAAPDLLENLPVFPSRFAGTRTLKLASELRLWREFVRDGVARHFPNSFLIIGNTDESAGLWPDDRLAKYFSVDRRAEYATATCVRTVDGAISVERTYSAQPGPLIEKGMPRWDYVPGDSFLDAFYAGDDSVRRELLGQWIELVRETTVDGVVPTDAIPTNLIVSHDGALHLIDNEFHHTGSVDRVIVRGLFWLAVHITRDTPPESWLPAQTIGDVVNYLAALVGVVIDNEAIDLLRSDEATFQVAVTTNYLKPDGFESASNAVTRLLDKRLEDLALGRRLHDDYQDAIKTRDHLKIHYAAAIEQRNGLRERLDRTVAQRDRLRAQNKKAAAARERLQTALDTKRQQVLDLKREVKKERALTARTERALTSLQRSRVHRTAESLRQQWRKVKSLVPGPR